jgi:thiol-disulfide isomerase/thioredoxin
MNLNRTRLILAAAVAVMGTSAFSYAADDGACCSSEGASSLLITADAQQDQAASADALLAKYKAVELPKFDQTKREDQAYIQDYIQKQNEAVKERAEIGKQFVTAYPDHAQAPQIARETVSALMGPARDPEAAKQLIATLLENDKASPELTREMKILEVNAMLMSREADVDAAWEAIGKLREEYPAEEQIAGLMARVADMSTGEEQIERLQATLDAFPDSRFTKYTKGKIRQAQSVGKPFEISFTNALTGEEVTSEDLKGKVVVVDFWATWCGPCIAEMPNMKKLYAEYKDKGVEFIGVSLDQAEEQGGKEALLKYCKENDIAWPQYYQGAFWDGEFSTAWGINSIPAIFIVDADGNLHSTEARGKLETLIPELIAKRDGKGPETASAEGGN